MRNISDQYCWENQNT